MPLALVAVLLASCLACGTAPAAVVPEYTITQLFAAARRSPQVRFAREFSDHARIVSASYRVGPDQVRHYYFHPTWGPQIRALLRADPLVRLEEVDRFLTGNLGRLRRASFYPEGFVTLQLAEPEYVMIIPVSLVTVRRSEEAVRRHLRLQ